MFDVENFTVSSWLIKLLLHRLGPARNECVLQGLSVLVCRKRIYLCIVQAIGIMHGENFYISIFEETA